MLVCVCRLPHFEVAEAEAINFHPLLERRGGEEKLGSGERSERRRGGQMGERSRLGGRQSKAIGWQRQFTVFASARKKGGNGNG